MSVVLVLMGSKGVYVAVGEDGCAVLRRREVDPPRWGGIRSWPVTSSRGYHVCTVQLRHTKRWTARRKLCTISIERRPQNSWEN